MLVVLHQGAIGDFLLTLSVVGAVRQLLESARVEVIASAASARWAAGRGIIDRCHDPDSVGLHTLFVGDGPLDPRLSQLLRSATTVLSFLAGPDEAIHERLTTATAGRVISVDPRPAPATLAAGTHVTEQWATEIRRQGLAIGEPVPPLTSPLPAATQTRRAIIHPGSGGRSKCWPMESFFVLADALVGQGVRMAWMLGPAECEPGNKTGAAVRQRAASTGEELIVEPDLAAAAEQIASCILYIGNDGGMTHVAAATGIPTLAVFTATDPRVWRPLGENVTAIDARSRRGARVSHILGRVRIVLNE